jgi:hypothetical protein
MWQPSREKNEAETDVMVTVHQSISDMLTSDDDSKQRRHLKTYENFVYLVLPIILQIF